MKKSIFTLGFVAVLSLTAVSCSTDDSALTDTSSTELKPSTGTTLIVDNGDKDLPKPPMKN